MLSTNMWSTRGCRLTQGCSPRRRARRTLWRARSASCHRSWASPCLAPTRRSNWACRGSSRPPFGCTLRKAQAVRHTTRAREAHALTTTVSSRGGTRRLGRSRVRSRARGRRRRIRSRVGTATAWCGTGRRIRRGRGITSRWPASVRALGNGTVADATTALPTHQF